MVRVGMILILAVSVFVVGCGEDAAPSRCPAEFPVERDGFCYSIDGDASVSLDGGPGSDLGAADLGTPDGGAVTLDGNVADAGPPVGDGGAVICVGEHPLLEGTRRYCGAGDCYCGTPDACFPQDIAAACCEVPVVCTGTDVDAGSPVICTGEHPNTTGMGSLRWCDPGNCFCADPDSCFPSDTADACCPGTVVCF